MNWLALLGLDVMVARWRVAAIEGAIAVEDRMELAKLEYPESACGGFAGAVVNVLEIGIAHLSEGESE